MSMIIEEQTLLKDFGELYSIFLCCNTFSKKKKNIADFTSLNTVYLLNNCKKINLDFEINSYQAKLFEKSKKRNLSNYNEMMRATTSYFLKCAKSYNSFIDENDYIPVYRYNSIENYSEYDAIGIILGFFASMGENEYNFVIRLIENGRISDRLMHDRYKGLCSRHSALDSYILFENNRYDLMSLYHLAHEIGHAYEYEMNKNRYVEQNNYFNKAFVEVSSCFYQYEFLRYLKENNVHLFDVNSMLNYYYTFCYEYLYILIECFDLDEIVANDELYVRKNDTYYIDKELNVIIEYLQYDNNLELISDKSYITHNYHRAILYGVGSYVAMHFSELRRQDPKEFKKRFAEFLTTRTLEGYGRNLEKMGLNLERLSTSDMIKPTLKRNIDDYKNQYKINCK